MIYASDDWMLAEVDIFQLGCAIYSISIWKKFEADVLAAESGGLYTQSLPLTNNIVYGNIIRKGCEGSYRNVKEVFADFEHFKSQNIHHFW